MKKTIQILAALLALQLLLAVGLHFGGERLNEVPPGEALLAAEVGAIDRIAIDGTNPNGMSGKVEIRKEGEKWLLGDGSEADPAKVRKMLDKIKAIELRTPVATTENAPQRFEVGERQYLRRIVLESGGKAAATVFFGKQIGTRQMHLRRGDQQVVYAGTFNVFDAPLTVMDWRAAPAAP